MSKKILSLDNKKRIKIGLVGMGTMGQIIASKLLENKYQVIGYDLLPKLRKRAYGIGVEIVNSVGDIAKKAKVILLSLPGPVQVKEVVSENKGLLSTAQKGQIIIDLSTVDPLTTRSMASIAEKIGVGYLDSPILGRPKSIGQWVLPIGGSIDYFKLCRPILQAFAKQVVYVGESGAGNALKLVNQLMFSTINAMTAEMMIVAKKTGLSPKIVFETISKSGAATVSGLFCEVAKKIVENNFDPIFSVDLLCKDNGLAVEMAKKSGAPPIISSSVQVLNEIAQAKGLGNKDTAALIKVYNDLLYK
ncbi:MAG TPA: NAD(P)-dependent oxidoreductase [Candidatus Atribacteria bacterium]|nr:NAD(P)-dependent oxidoreductase [Candidatus Atribacteria bacterium]